MHYAPASSGYRHTQDQQEESVRLLSKSKILAYRQCPRRLWLEIYRKDLRADSAASEATFRIGHTVGEVARRIYDPAGTGVLIDLQAEGLDGAFAHTRCQLEIATPIFEAGFASEGAMAFSDVLLPAVEDRHLVWRMVEVKSSTEVKDYHQDDVALQSLVARSAGVPLASVALAHIDSTWVYPGNEDYAGLLVEEDLTAAALARADEVRAWIAEAHAIADRRDEPQVRTGRHCSTPYDCGFHAYCSSQEPQAEYPVAWLPRVQAQALRAHLESGDVIDMRDVPDKLLNDLQLRVKAHTLSGQVYFDALGAAADLAPYGLPAYFLDFETIAFAVPIWKGTRPFQQIPFQFSLHRLDANGALAHEAFLDLSGADPSEVFTTALLQACGTKGPVFVYNQAFEKTRIRELADRFPQHAPALLALNERIVDLLPVARNRFYHPCQKGSWSIKSVLPAVAPDLDYAALEGVQDGGMAMDAYLEAIAVGTSRVRRDQIRSQLLDYCRLDTYAMVRVWKVFTEQSIDNSNRERE